MIPLVFTYDHGILQVQCCLSIEDQPEFYFSKVKRGLELPQVGRVTLDVMVLVNAPKQFRVTRISKPGAVSGQSAAA